MRKDSFAVMTSNDIKNIQDMLQAVFERYRDKVLFAYLFGSAVQNTGYPPRDIDIAVFLVLQPQQSLFETRLALHADLCRTLKKKEVDLVVLNTMKNIVFLDEIVRRGVVVYDADPVLRENFEIETLHRAIDFKNQRLAIIGI